MKVQDVQKIPTDWEKENHAHPGTDSFALVYFVFRQMPFFIQKANRFFNLSDGLELF